MSKSERTGGWRRLWGLVRKETLQIRRDPSSIILALVMPVVLLLLFGYGVSLDARRVPLAIVVPSPGTRTTALIGHFSNSEYFAPRRYRSVQAAETALARREVDGILHFQADFERQLATGSDPAPIQLIVNGVDANRARLIGGYVEAVLSIWLAQQADQGQLAVAVPVRLQPRLWFNQQVRSQNFLVPGLIVLIMTLIGALLTALVLARERERGTLESLFVTPVTPREILLGKLIPYFLLGMGGMAVSVVMAVFLFEVPLRGSLWTLTGMSGLFLLVALGMGLLISIMVRNQFLASQTAIIATYLPAFFLSGFMFDLNSTPRFIQIISRAIAARYFVSALQTIFLAGDVWSVLLPNAAALGIMAVIFLGLTRMKMRKSLE